MVFFSTHCHGHYYPDLPEAVSNNAVALVKTDRQAYLLSFMGLGADKGQQDVHNQAWALPLALGSEENAEVIAWQALPQVPYVAPLAGRLASVAIGIKDQAYLFGGYTVSANHDELSTSDSYRFDITRLSYQPIADMPVPVDDTAAASYQDRFIYLFGGWHQDGNVNLVQVYDTELDTWAQASPIPAAGVFGQAVGMVNNQLVLCDGVKVKPNIGKRREYQGSPVCLLGKIAANNHLRIDWQLLPHYSVKASTRTSEHKSLPTQRLQAHYRMAATGVAYQDAGQVIFIGGSSHPYNYNGIGYDGKPSSASNMQYTFDLKRQRWLKPSRVTEASMDHRGLLCYQGQLIRLGGMLAQQKVSAQVLTSSLTGEQSCLQ